jgi:hypothetical protein
MTPEGAPVCCPPEMAVILPYESPWSGSQTLAQVSAPSLERYVSHYEWISITLIRPDSWQGYRLVHVRFSWFVQQAAHFFLIFFWSEEEATRLNEQSIEACHEVGEGHSWLQAFNEIP